MLDRINLTNIIAYCRACAPDEAGGYIGPDGNFYPLRNKALNPSETFRFDHVPEDAIALIHSHPGGPFAPSEMDQMQQAAMDIPWGIVAFTDDRTEIFWFGDTAPMEPLNNRGFRHYVTDCYAGVRDLYRTHCGVVLPNFPRSWDWWSHGQHLFLHGFEKAGFHEVARSDVREGDVLLMSIKSATPNHSAVWIGKSLIYHHMSSRTESEPSNRAVVESDGRWIPFISMVLRHENGGIARTPWALVREKLSSRY